MTHASIAVRPLSPQYFRTSAIVNTDNPTKTPPSDESAALLGDQRLPDDRCSFFVQQTSIIETRHDFYQHDAMAATQAFNLLTTEGSTLSTCCERFGSLRC